jgi:hypothetical protein
MGCRSCLIPFISVLAGTWRVLSQLPLQHDVKFQPGPCTLGCPSTCNGQHHLLSLSFSPQRSQYSTANLASREKKEKEKKQIEYKEYIRMADADNATRAPESDAQETPAASDNIQAPVVGEHCVSDRPTRTTPLRIASPQAANNRSFGPVLYRRNHQAQRCRCAWPISSPSSKLTLPYSGLRFETNRLPSCAFATPPPSDRRYRNQVYQQPDPGR